MKQNIRFLISWILALRYCKKYMSNYQLLYSTANMPFNMAKHRTESDEIWILLNMDINLHLANLFLWRKVKTWIHQCDWLPKKMAAKKVGNIPTLTAKFLCRIKIALRKICLKKLYLKNVVWQEHLWNRKMAKVAVSHRGVQAMMLTMKID